MNATVRGVIVVLIVAVVAGCGNGSEELQGKKEAHSSTVPAGADTVAATTMAEVATTGGAKGGKDLSAAMTAGAGTTSAADARKLEEEKLMKDAAAAGVEAAEQRKAWTARDEIEMIGGQLEAMKEAIGRYPTKEEGLGLLMKGGPNMAKWDGPYLTKLPVDPWGHPYLYRFPGEKNREGFDLYCDGHEMVANNWTKWPVRPRFRF